MKMWKSFTVMTMLAVLAVSPVAEAGGKGAKARNLSPEEAETLVFMREEEKLARDVYRVMYDLWSKPIFTNIADSEQNHMDTMLAMINFYRLSDPVVDDSTGAFVNTDLATAYLDLTTWGMESLKEALMVGAYIEELDILDLEEAIEESSQDKLDAAYEELMRGSRNHLRAFVGELESMGIVYEAQLMEQHDVDEIVDSPMERGS